MVVEFGGRNLSKLAAFRKESSRMGRGALVFGTNFNRGRGESSYATAGPFEGSGAEVGAVAQSYT
jgi:hypothetical protein